ncbi:hypothetical protein MmTuc01_1987 [Methanosarcina mazei Tuc01]|uniref:Uncharacterized protein n=1 Tax=Methanosarcina mazei Tuc01 TaxID=1236903 RepID=M1Q4S4_METMZ|nr:hypothetical protein MmTuc01_1987 [Methanosarcina mazei Tuc01]
MRQHREIHFVLLLWKSKQKYLQISKLKFLKFSKNITE